jgi:mRNA-degrading endonuclease toxin of MazEF toxin-antitoxin module
MALEFGDIVLVPFPFTDQTASKRRPAVIVSNAGYNLAKADIVVMAVTTKICRRAPPPPRFARYARFAWSPYPAAPRPAGADES